MLRLGLLLSLLLISCNITSDQSDTRTDTHTDTVYIHYLDYGDTLLTDSSQTGSPVQFNTTYGLGIITREGYYSQINRRPSNIMGNNTVPSLVEIEDSICSSCTLTGLLYTVDVDFTDYIRTPVSVNSNWYEPLPRKTLYLYSHDTLIDSTVTDSLGRYYSYSAIVPDSIQFINWYTVYGGQQPHPDDPTQGMSNSSRTVTTIIPNTLTGNYLDIFEPTVSSIAMP